MKDIKIIVIILIIIFLTSCIKINEIPINGERDISTDIEVFREEYQKLLNEDIQGAIRLLDDNISSFDSLEATKAVEGLMYSLHQELINNEEYIKLIEIGVDAEISISEIEDFYNNTNDEKLKETYLSLDDYLLKIRNNEKEDELTNLSYVDIDYNKVLEKYKDYIYEDLIDLTEYYKEEKVYVFNEANDELLLEDILLNIIKLEDIIERHPDSAYLNEFNKNLNYNYQMYFGALNDGYGVFDEKGKIHEYALSHYNDMVKDNINKKIVKKIEEYLKVLEKEEFKNTDNLKVFLLDFTNKDYEVIN